ncbi:MAG: hypothetical protein H7329_08670 [Opitutaceae bacterium]|nr:hypothetical protein [Cytophagales bacterium]
MKEENDPSGKTSIVIGRWIAANYFRMILTLLGWIAALKALTIYSTN